MLVITTRPESETWSSAWLKAFEKHGVFVQSTPVEIGKLPQWISQRASKVGLTMEPGAAEFLAERVEGNLLAAQQELEKLALLPPAGRVCAGRHGGGRRQQRAVRRLPARRSGARWRCAATSLRILEGLRGEGAEPPLMLWALCRELRALADVRRHPGAGAGYGRQAERRAALVARAAERTARQPIGPLFVEAATRRPPDQGPAGQAGDPWTALTALVADDRGRESRRRAAAG